jgi:hypothetical protein
LRAQLVVALVGLLILVAVPLYLWRRPGAAESAPSASVGSSSPPVSASSLASAVVPDAGTVSERVRLGPPQRVRCGPNARSKAREGPLCDQLPYFEEALKKAIRENVDCAPRAKTEGTINFVLQVDFGRKKVHVFPGASGGWRGTQARRATKCVLRSLPAPPWTSLQHRETYYQMAILATYLEPGQASASLATPATSGSAAPLFE